MRKVENQPHIFMWRDFGPQARDEGRILVRAEYERGPPDLKPLPFYHSPVKGITTKAKRDRKL